MPGYMQGSKRARNASSLVNRTNTCGGVKKGGLSPTVGVDATVGSTVRRRGISQQQYVLTCPSSYANYRPVASGVGMRVRLVPGQNSA